MGFKIVVTGNVNGQLSNVFSKLSALHAKQNFAFAIIAGNLFANPETASDAENAQVTELLGGDIPVPLPTYFATGDWRLPDDVVEKLESNFGEVCPNLTAFGRKVSIKTSEGLRIVAVGGTEFDDVDESSSQYAAQYTIADAESLAKGAVDADILITSDWPAHIETGSKVQMPTSYPNGKQCIAELCLATKPRYHFSTSESYFEREPFFHNGPSPRTVTRFLSLAPFGNASKQKWIYAFSLEPSAAPPENLPPGCTAAPFVVANKKRKLESQEADYNNFRYANGNGNAPAPRDSYKPKRNRYQPPPTPQQCYFCLSNPDSETHMIASIGSQSYATIAKGPLTTRATFPTLNFPGHILLIPHEHQPTLDAIPDKDTRHKTVSELQLYRTALHKMLVARSQNSQGKSQLGAVTWEISRAGGVHLHWQFLPVPVAQIPLIEAAFKAKAEQDRFSSFASTVQEVEAAEEGDYFKVMIWSEDFRKDMILPLDNSFRFDLQFGRRVLAMLMGLESRVDWRACAQTQQEEETDKEAFRAAFEAFEPQTEDE